MQTILFIDTSDSMTTTVKLFRDGAEKVYQEKTDHTKSQNVLPLIQKALHTESLQLSDLTEIQVNEGPGSFTGLRVGVTVANTLGWVLQIPVNGKESAVPQYQASKFD